MWASRILFLERENLSLAEEVGILDAVVRSREAELLIEQRITEEERVRADLCMEELVELRSDVNELETKVQTRTMLAGGAGVLLVLVAILK